MNNSVCPADAFVAGTADQGVKVLTAVKELGIPVSVCAAQRSNAAVTWGVGVNGSVYTGKEP